ncbi:MAG: nitroreductase [Gammaproteobacteria bacterium]|nr:nitroreductase [Gammaproteobacteria bacterium]
MTPLEQVYAYHQRSKHHLEQYAAGPETLDWDHQPDPFRRFSGSATITLPLTADQHTVSWQQLHQNPPSAAPLQLESIATLLELSLGISAWKEYGDSRWALRCNPSSGNLHPGEGYLISSGIPDLDDGLYHYAPQPHALEQRCCFSVGETALYLGLSSVIWREAWKYGERAFRYVQLDCGHALGALTVAAAVLGWKLEIVPCSSEQLATVLGVQRESDFVSAEKESPDLLLRLCTTATEVTPEQLAVAAKEGVWSGKANRLGGEPALNWPLLTEIETATVASTPLLPPPPAEALPPAIATKCTTAATTLIRTRRSAQAFDGATVIASDTFYRILDALLPREESPIANTWPYRSRIHLVLFVHRVEGLPPGLYALPRHPEAEEALRQAMNPQFLWERLPSFPPTLPLRHLIRARAENAAQKLSCQQAIAANSCFTVAMLSEFNTTLSHHPAEYRRLYWEAGLLGQILYLEAEAAAIRGTGIGCFFDDPLHTTLGLEGTAWQCLYHFTVGGAITDTRIATYPPYPGSEER